MYSKKTNNIIKYYYSYPSSLSLSTFLKYTVMYLLLTTGFYLVLNW